MPFDEEEDKPSTKSKQVGLKNVSSQKSIFDSLPKKPTQEDFDKQVKQVQERNNGYKIKAAELALQFNKSMADKTLSENKNMFQQDMEREIMQKMVQLAIEINNDPNEAEGMGSMTWITLLMKTCFAQRDRINKLEYALVQLEKKTDKALISKENSSTLDSKKTSE